MPTYNKMSQYDFVFGFANKIDTALLMLMDSQKSGTHWIGAHAVGAWQRGKRKKGSIIRIASK